MTLRRLVCSLLLLAPIEAFSQQAPAATEAPISVSFGPDADGNVGVVLKGTTYYPVLYRGAVKSTEGGFYTPSGFIYFSPEAHAASGDSPSQFSISARPTYQVGYQKRQPTPVDLTKIVHSRVWPAKVPFLEVYADVRRHYGELRNADTQAVTDVDVTLIGAGVGVAIPGLSRAVERYIERVTGNVGPAALPMLRVTYYNAAGDAGSSPLTKNIKVDQLDLTLKFEVPLRSGFGGKISPKLEFDGSASRPTTGDDAGWNSLVRAALMAKLGNSQFKPVIRFTAGERFGFEFDRQILIGFAYELANAAIAGGR